MDPERPTLQPHGEGAAIAGRARAALAHMDKALAALRQRRTFGEAGPPSANSAARR